jgi:hypothetical protein
MAFLVKRGDVSMSELIEHYENHHVPLILSLGPAPRAYRRNFIQPDESREALDDFNVITELVFADRAAYQTWASTMYAPGSGVAEDEATFLDRSRTRSYVVDERITQ